MTADFPIPAGYALVPLEPNAAMEEAGEAAFFAYPQRSRAHWAVICGDAYRAMLAAAPPTTAVVGEPVATMVDAIAAGYGTLHGAIDYWQGRAFAAEAGRDVGETNKVLADNYLRDTTPVASRAGSEPSAQAQAPQAEAEDLAQQLADAHDQGARQATDGVHEVSAGFDDLPFEGCPEDWAFKPFARISMFYDSGDASVGEPARSGWTLTEDQAGTVVGDLAKALKAREDFAWDDDTLDELWFQHESTCHSKSSFLCGARAILAALPSATAQAAPAAATDPAAMVGVEASPSRPAVPAVDWHDAWQRECAKFQQETRRTSQLAQLLHKWVERHEAEHGPGPWAKGCEVCALVGESRALLDRPINAGSSPAARESLTDAQIEAEFDVKRMDWLDAQSTEALLEFGFEMDGGVYLRIEAPGCVTTDIREKNSARAAIDFAMTIRPAA